MESCDEALQLMLGRVLDRPYDPSTQLNPRSSFCNSQSFVLFPSKLFRSDVWQSLEIQFGLLIDISASQLP